MKKVPLIAMFLIVAQLLGCSAMVMSIGPDQSEIAKYEQTREFITSALGEPRQVEQFDPPMTVHELAEMYKGATFLLDKNEMANSGKSALLEERYLYIGDIQKSGEVGDAVAVSGYTWGIGEIFMLPAALSYKSKASKTEHEVTIWYDQNERAMAYFWAEY